jgi:hypothetical protein
MADVNRISMVDYAVIWKQKSQLSRCLEKLVIMLIHIRFCFLETFLFYSKTKIPKA